MIEKILSDYELNNVINIEDLTLRQLIEQIKKYESIVENVSTTKNNLVKELVVRIERRRHI